MTDKDKIFGSDSNDPKPRMAGRITPAGFVVTPALIDPTPPPQTESVKHVGKGD